MDTLGRTSWGRTRMQGGCAADSSWTPTSSRAPQRAAPSKPRAGWPCQLCHSFSGSWMARVRASKTPGKGSHCEFFSFFYSRRILGLYPSKTTHTHPSMLLLGPSYNFFYLPLFFLLLHCTPTQGPHRNRGANPYGPSPLNIHSVLHGIHTQGPHKGRTRGAHSCEPVSAS